MVTILRLKVVTLLVLLLLSSVSVQAQQAPAPTGLTAADTTTTGTYLTWDEPTDSNGAVHGYNIYKCDATAVPGCNPVWLAWVMPNWHTYYGDYTLSPGTTYRFAVGSSRGAGTESAWSNVVTVTTLSQPVPAPTGLAAQDTTTTYTHLTWGEPTDGNGVVDGYNVWRCEGVGCTLEWVAWLQYNWHNYYSDDGSGALGPLRAGTTYRYAVKSHRSGSDSPFSNEITVTTLSQASVPTGLSVRENPEENVLRWSAPADDGKGAILGYNVYRCDATAVPDCNPVWKVWVDGRSTTTYTDRGVTTGTTYRYAVGSSRGAGTESAWSNVVTATAAPPLVLKVTGLKATAASADSISLSWKPSVKDVMTTYSVYRCTMPEGESTCDPYDGLWLANLENTNAYTDTEVTPGETYRYAVAVEPYRREELSRAITVVAQMPQMLSAPTGLMVTEVDESSVRLRWTAPEDDGRGPVESIDIYRCNVDRSPDCSEFLYLTSRNPALTEYKDNDVESDTTYRYAVAAYRSDDEVSPWSNQMTATTQSLAPAAPTSLRITSTSETAISLSWTAPDSVVDAYNVFRCVEEEEGCVPEWYVWLEGGTITTFMDTDLSAETTYRYAVEAIRYNRSTSPWTEFKSPWSNQVTALADAGTEPPAEAVQAPAPTGLTVTLTSATAISLSWTAPADDGNGALYGYNVFRCEEGETACEPQWIAWVDGGASTGYTDDGRADPDGTPVGLSAGSTYRYAVGASRGQGTESAWSNQVTALADAGTEPPAEAVQAPAPTGLTVTSTSATAISLSWTAPADDGNGALYGYNVFRCEEGETACEPQWIAWVDGGASTGYTDDGRADPDGTPVGLSAGSTYRYAVGASRGQGTESAWSNQVTALADAGTEPPAEAVQAPAPTGLTVTSTSATAISLSWTAPADDGNGALYGYNVFRCEEGETACEPQWIAWVDGGASTGYTDDGRADPDGTPVGLSAGSTYRYAVGASRGQGTESAWSNQVTALADAGTEPPAEAVQAPAPTGLTVTSTSATAISLSWTAPADDGNGALYGYNVFRCEEGETACEPQWIAWVDGGASTGYTDDGRADPDGTPVGLSAGSTYRYAVGASRGQGTESAWSNQVTALADAGTEPPAEAVQAPAPTGLTVTSTSATAISLSWTAPTDDGNGALYGYNVFRCEEGETACEPQWIAWVDGGASTGYTDDGRADPDGTPVGLSAGSTYRYAVGASRGQGTESAWSNQVTALADAGTEPPAEAVQAPAPTGLTVTSTSATAISLSWTAPADDGNGALYGYNVFRCEEGETACEPQWIAWVDGGASTGYTDDGRADPDGTPVGLSAGSTYRYAVGASRGQGTESAWSNQVTALADAGTEPPAEAVQAPAPTGLTVTSTSATAISLSWTAPADDGNGAIIGYNVYRCDTGPSCTPEWKVWVDGGTTTTYTDSDVTTGITYRYAVGASRGQGTESPWSNQVTATAGEADVGGPSPEERVLTLESGMAALGRTMAGQAVDTFGGRFASLSTSVGTQAASANRRLDSFSGALKLAAEQMGIPMAVADVDDVLHAGPEWGPWMSDADLLTEACSATVSGCPEDTEGNLMLGNLTLRQLLSQNSFQLALGESDDSGASAWTLWGRGNVSGFKGQSANELALDGEVVSGYLGLDYRWGTDTLLGVAVSHSTGDIDYEETETGAGELETTMRSVYPYAYWSPRPGLGLWGVLGYGSGETALTDTAVSNLETDVEMWMAALGGRSELFTLGRVDLAVKADAFSVRMESDTLEALESTRVDSGRLRLALEGRTSLTLSEHSRLTPSLELGARWDSGDAETGLGAELGGALAYTNTRLGLSMEAGGRYLLTHEEESFEEWGASVSACVSSGGDGTGLALSLKPVWGNAASGVDALWEADGRTRVEGMGLATPRSASWQPDRLDLGLRYGSDTPHGLLSPFGEVGLQGSDTYSMRLGTQLDTATGWKLDVFGGHVSRSTETADNLVGLTASYGFGAAGMNQAFAGTMPATSNWSTCDKGPAQKMSSRTEPETHRHETTVMQPAEETNNGRNPAAADNRTATAVARKVGAASAEHTRIDKQSARADQVIVPQQTEEAANWFIPVANTSRTVMVVAQQTDEAPETTPQAGAETHSDEAAAVSGENEKVTDKAVSSAMEEVTVKGIRRALKDALDVKRSSDHIVEALSLEDIDAIPNVTIAEALVRLPGVNGTRDRGNQSQATIRGLGPRMVLGTVNGREVASAEPSRNIRWEQYPSELISQVQVYKTQSADLIAGGIAGTINLETVAPLDYNGPKYTFNGVGAYYEGGKDIPNYSELGNKLSGSLVKAFNNKIGIALGVASQKQKNAFPSYQGWGFNSPGSWQPDFPADGGDLDGQGTTGFVPWGTQIEVGKMDTDRIGLLGALQFRPSDAIDIRYDVLYSEFDMNIEQDQTWYQGTGNTNNLQAGFYSDVEVVDGLALAATAQSPVPGCIHSPDGSEPPSIPQCFDIRHVLSLYDQENSVFTQGLNLEFSGDTIHVNADIAYSKAERKNYWHGLYFDDRNATFSYDFRGKPSVSVPEGSPSARPETAQLAVVDCNTGFCGSLNSNENQGSNLEDESWSYQLNINKSLDAGHLSSVDLGIRYSDRNKEVVWEQFKMSRGGDNPAQVLPDGFISYTLSALDTSPLLTAPSFKTAVNMFGGLDFSLAEIDEERYWRVSEENLAGYVKANFEGSIGSSSYYTANVGVRVVDVGTDSFDIRGAAIGNNYTEVLPSASLNLFLDEEKIIRLSASRAISRPPLDELRVGKLINAPAGSIEGNTGNPLLTPFISKQLDLSYEWYFAPESLAAATVYYKKIDDYIGYTYLDFEIKDGRIFYIYGPKNEQEGNIRGVELTFQAPYTSLLPKALKGVSAGIYSNYAYADSNIKELYPVDSPYSLAGLARHTATVDLWFWWRKFDLRFGWKYHSAFTTGFGWDGSELSTLDAETNISASLAYIVNDNITLRVQGYNLTDEPARSTRNNNGYNLRRFDKYGRAYFFGVSWKMW